MIHSLAGGVIREKKCFDFAKVKLESGDICWYISNIFGLKEKDKVLVPFGKDKVKGEVLRIDKNVNEQMSPIPVKRAKEILEKIN